MKNADLKAMIDKYGERVRAIHLDNGHSVKIGYPGMNPVSVKDILFDKFGDTEVFGVRYKSNYSHDRDIGVTYVNWHDTAFIQDISIMDEGFENYCIDPYMI